MAFLDTLFDEQYHLSAQSKQTDCRRRREAGSAPEGLFGNSPKNIEVLGFTFSPSLIRALYTLSKEQFKDLYDEIIAALKAMVGAHVKYCPMYPDFPMQVMQADDVELYLNAMYHYHTLDLPRYETADRPPFLDRVNLKVIGLGSKAELHTMMRQLIQAKGSISDTDKRTSIQFWSSQIWRQYMRFSRPRFHSRRMPDS